MGLGVEGLDGFVGFKEGFRGRGEGKEGGEGGEGLEFERLHFGGFWEGSDVWDGVFEWIKLVLLVMKWGGFLDFVILFYFPHSYIDIIL